MSLCLARKVVRQEHFFQEQLQRRSFFRYRPVDLSNTSLLLCSCLTTLCSPYVLGTRTLLWLRHGCSGHRMFLEHERYCGLGMGALVTVCSGNTHVIMVKAWVLWSPYALGTRTLLWFGHGCSGHRMLWEHELYYALGMGALFTVCSWNTNFIMVWARVH